ncbi:hypothetical protein ABZT26_36075 [Streptomyces sp. NPDC005395]|uniref:hypothetical protein n=1 Tax=Streptomyces sp. NPDC005395 TaxID=3157042 RepID=UPI0033A02DBA
MTRQQKRAMGLLLGVASLLVIIVVAARDGGSDTSGLDERSYKAGYGAFGGANLPPSDEDREMVEIRCEEFFRPWAAGHDDAVTLDRDSWVTGCADYLEVRDSRF